uniref:CUB domain-containing protein n=1 Tax=Panagrellus redivivus TaxID=6233 RepID=A0A7E4WA20_PANRE
MLPWMAAHFFSSVLLSGLIIQLPRHVITRVTDCKRAVFDQNGGNFHTVGFPRALTPPQCFLYHFVAPVGHHIEVEFVTVEVPSAIGSEWVLKRLYGGFYRNCCSCVDFVHIYDELKPNGSAGDVEDYNYREFCGKNIFEGEPAFVSSKNHLFIEINAGMSKSVRIKGVYRVLKATDYAPDAVSTAPSPTSCEYRVNGLTGELFSPRAPYYAPTNMTCSYAFPALRDHVLKINLTGLDVPKTDCHDSYLGVWRLKPRILIENLCSGIDLPYLISTHEGLWLEFRTGLIERRIRGFRLHYEYIASGNNASLASSSHVGSGTASQVAVDLPLWAAILGSPTTTNPTGGGPGGTSNRCPVRVVSTRAQLPSLDDAIPLWANNSGVLSSEHFVPSENTNFKCQFVFVGAPDEHVQIVFRKFRLFTWKDKGINSTNEMRCEEMDHVAAHVLVGSRMSKIDDFCGSEIPPPLMSAKNILTLDYVVKTVGSAREVTADDEYGFVIEYRFLSDWGQQPAEARQVPAKPCGFRFNSSIQTKGHFWSANHPGYYPRNLDCEFVFYGNDGQIVVIHFEYFDVEGFGQCEQATHSDFVLFSNYMTTDRTNRRYCGAQRPPGAIASESNYFRMLFRTNDIFDGTGFYGHYQFIDQQSNKMANVKLATSSRGVLQTAPPGVTVLLSMAMGVILSRQTLGSP